MPIKIPDHLPAKEILEAENIFVMAESRAYHQDIRPLKILILNLMPTKIETETQLLRLLGNTPLQVEITFIHPKSHVSKNTSSAHLSNFYSYFNEVQHQNFDGMVITGAPVETLSFEEVDYWKELVEIMEWSKTHVFSTLHICWAAQAGLYYHFGIPKYELPEKHFGVFQYYVNLKYEKLFRGFDDFFYMPQSRHTEVRYADIMKCADLEILSLSDDQDINIVAVKDRSQFFFFFHSEYDALTLKAEYDRDIHRGLSIPVPKNYYPEDDPTRTPHVLWRAHANLLFSNWLNYYVYQETPYEIGKLQSKEQEK